MKLNSPAAFPMAPTWVGKRVWLVVPSRRLHSDAIRCCFFQASLFRGLSPGGRRETGIALASKAGSFRFYFFELPPG